ncbi:hypothetical protein MP228_004874 [Amoeboaphelidium protococcarum]|nr:hypothetical protein MP228_004874 [Amoeboaphelidium protococcarum]
MTAAVQQNQQQQNLSKDKSIPSTTTTTEKQLVNKNQVQRAYDIFIAKSIVNGGIGLGVGLVSSVLLFRRRFFPIPLALGFSLGMAYEELRRNLSLEQRLNVGPYQRVVPSGGGSGGELSSGATEQSAVVKAVMKAVQDTKQFVTSHTGEHHPSAEASVTTTNDHGNKKL